MEEEMEMFWDTFSPRKMSKQVAIITTFSQSVIIIYFLDC
jgi:hypothetical protein